MAMKLFLLDGMALAYRAHFAFLQRPIRTSKGLNTSALYGFTLTLLDLMDREKPTHLAVALDTSAPTQRHVDFPEYKAQREAMPEDLSLALPNIRRICELFRIPLLIQDGYEADDIIGTLARQASKEGYETYMVTPDKDFGQLVDERTFIYKPGRAGDGVEILGVPEVCAKWGIQKASQVIDILALWGDASDNIPGVPGVGEKTAAKLISQYGDLEGVLAHAEELKGKLKESLIGNAEQARLCRRLATILIDVPVGVTVDSLRRAEMDSDGVRNLFVEFEFNSLGRRVFGEGFKAGRGFQPGEGDGAQSTSVESGKGKRIKSVGPGVPDASGQLGLFGDSGGATEAQAGSGEAEAEGDKGHETAAAGAGPQLKTVADVEHEYRIAESAEERSRLVKELCELSAFCFDSETTGLDPKTCRVVGLSFCWKAHTGWYVPVPQEPEKARAILAEFGPVFTRAGVVKVGHNLKFDLSVLRWQGIPVVGPFWDTMIAHALIEPDQRHGMDYLSEALLGYTPIPITQLIGEDDKSGLDMSQVPVDRVAEYAAEDADVTWQLYQILEPRLKEHGLERVFHEVESPLIPVLAEMEYEGIKADSDALVQFSKLLEKRMAQLQVEIQSLAGTEFNLNSPKQLGEILFDKLKIAEKPKKTKTGQYATNEQVLQDLAVAHPIVQAILDHRGATKLKSTYADALPAAIFPGTGRIHTTFHQVLASTGRLSSVNPNLQNIPIRTEQGQEIRRAFVPRGPGFALLSADYSQIELRIIAALSQDKGMQEAFASGMDIHAATAARVYGVMPDLVSSEMRRNAKMVNFGIAYGISAFGLAQRLGIPRAEAAALIENYFREYPGTKKYIEETLAFAREHGYVQTVIGRRRYLPDVRSANAAVRGAAERNAINMPIQGTAADMIKIAMVRIQDEIWKRKLKTRMVLQVHDELVFDLWREEEAEVRELVGDLMRKALPLDVPIEVEMGVGETWLEAH